MKTLKNTLRPALTHPDADSEKNFRGVFFKWKLQTQKNNHFSKLQVKKKQVKLLKLFY